MRSVGGVLISLTGLEPVGG